MNLTVPHSDDAAADPTLAAPAVAPLPTAPAPLATPSLPAAPAPGQAATGGIQPVHIDGALYVAMGFLAALYAGLSTDDAVKFIAPATLWWFRLVIGSFNGGVLALKMYRSTSFAESKNGGANGHA